MPLRFGSIRFRKPPAAATVRRQLIAGLMVIWAGVIVAIPAVTDGSAKSPVQEESVKSAPQSEDKQLVNDPTKDTPVEETQAVDRMKEASPAKDRTATSNEPVTETGGETVAEAKP